MARSRDPLGRAMQVLRFLVEHPAHSVGVREVAAALSLQPSSVSRSLAALERERLVQRDPKSGKFSPHLDLVRLGLHVRQKLDIRTVARPHLQHLVERCNESAFLGVYDPVWKQMLRVEGIHSSRPLRYVVELDQWTEIYRGASGLGILAYLPEKERDEVLAMSDAAASDEEPWLRREELEPFLARIREKGYAFTKSRRIEGAVGISAPVFDAESRVIASVILTIPDVRFNGQDESEYASLVTEAAAKITAGLGGSVPAKTPRTPLRSTRSLPDIAESDLPSIDNGSDFQASTPASDSARHSNVRRRRQTRQ